MSRIRLRGSFRLGFAFGLGVLAANCGGDGRDFHGSGGAAGAAAHSGGRATSGASGGGKVSAAGGVANEAGGEQPLAGTGGAKPDPDAGLGGSAGTSGEVTAGAPASGGVSAAGEAGAGGSSGQGGEAGSAAVGECDASRPCSDKQRPFCDSEHRCVACLKDADCGAATGECFARSCVLGACRETAKLASAPCGSDVSTECDAPDSCDGAGHCLKNLKQAGNVCGTKTASECDGVDTCDGAGKCLPNFAVANTACGSPSSSVCDAPDSCDGAGHCQPNYKPPTTTCDDQLFCNGADKCDGAGQCQHEAVVCGGRTCFESQKRCACDTGPVVVTLCASDEQSGRDAHDRAQAACATCGSGDSIDHTSTTTANGCLQYHCLP